MLFGDWNIPLDKLSALVYVLVVFGLIEIKLNELPREARNRLLHIMIFLAIFAVIYLAGG